VILGAITESDSKLCKGFESLTLELSDNIPTAQPARATAVSLVVLADTTSPIPVGWARSHRLQWQSARAGRQHRCGDGGGVKSDPGCSGRAPVGQGPDHVRGRLSHGEREDGGRLVPGGRSAPGHEREDRARSRRELLETGQFRRPCLPSCLQSSYSICEARPSLPSRFHSNLHEVAKVVDRINDVRILLHDVCKVFRVY